MSKITTRPDDTPEDDTVSNSRLMRGVKIAIVLMGILIVMGFAFIGAEVYRRATDPDYAAQRGGAPVALTLNEAGPGRTRGGLTLPGGSVIGDPVAVGNRFAVTVRMPDGTHALYVVNPGQNEIVEFMRSDPAR